MGALPSRETHERGLYSHRHGRNRRNEIILIPLTSTFFPSPDSPLFQHLFKARQRRTAKYYYRALRGVDMPRESDYFCTVSAVSDPLFAEFNDTRLMRQKAAERRNNNNNNSCSSGHVSPGSREGCGSTGSPLTMAMDNGSNNNTSRGGSGGVVGAGASSPYSTDTAVTDPEAYLFESFSDTPEGLYQILIADNECGMFDTDVELREAYLKQVKRQREEWCRASRHFSGCNGNPAVSSPYGADAVPSSGGSTSESLAPPYAYQHSHYQQQQQQHPPYPGFGTGPAPVLENVAFDAFISGYAAAKRYVKGRALHTTYVNAASYGTSEGINGATPATAADASSGGAGGGEANSCRGTTSQRKHRHVTSPAAYYVRPIPCAIASRYDPNKPQPVNDPLYIEFEGSYVKIMGMFGTFPATVPMKYRGTSAEEGGEGDAAGGGHEGTKRKSRLRKEGRSDYDDGAEDAETQVEQHLMKGTMFIDKDVGDQILGNVVMLATHMYVRQCVEAKIQPHCIPMLPVLLRTPLSNIPMLQFIREFRVRLRTLLNAGAANAGQKPLHSGISGFNAEDIAGTHNPQQARQEEEAYLFEEDVPNATTTKQLFYDFAVHSSNNSSSGTGLGSVPLRRHGGNNTNPNGKLPILMMSGFNVQTTPLRHPALNYTGGGGGGAAGPHLFPSHSTLSTGSSKSKKTSQGQQSKPYSPTSGNVLPLPDNPSAPSSPNSFCSSFPSQQHLQQQQQRLLYPQQQQKASQTQSGAGLCSPTSGTAPLSSFRSEARKRALLTRRKYRFRMWVEDGHLCVWASAAYARRACLILAQQLNTTVDSSAVPEQRSWQYRGVLHGGTTVPPPSNINEVMVVGEDIPEAGLWQGDVLRCSTATELAARQRGMPLPLPCVAVLSPQHVPTSAAAAAGAPATGTTGTHLPGSHAIQVSNSTPTAAPAGSGSNINNAGSSTYSAVTPSSSHSTMTGGEFGAALANSTSDSAVRKETSISGGQQSITSPIPTIAAGGSVLVNVSEHVNYTSNHVSNPLLQPPQEAPPGAFWVRGSGGLDDSFINISESIVPQTPKVEKLQQQQNQGKGKKTLAATTPATTVPSSAMPGAAAAASSPTAGTAAGKTACGAVTSSNASCLEIDRREGTLHLEEIILAWIKVISIVTRDAREEDDEWVRDPNGVPVCIDRYLIRRLEHDRIRFFVGVTPRFMGQHRKIERMLGEVYALDEEEAAAAAAGGGSSQGGQKEAEVTDRWRDDGRGVVSQGYSTGTTSRRTERPPDARFSAGAHFPFDTFAPSTANAATHRSDIFQTQRRAHGDGGGGDDDDNAEVDQHTELLIKQIGEDLMYIAEE